MIRQVLAVLVLACSLAACSVAPIVSQQSVPWLDESFAYESSLVTVGADDLFRLPPDLRQKLRDADIADTGPNYRLKHLIDMVFGADRRSFAYVAGHSTIAADTWHDKRGDCLSLTVLTFALARELGMDALVQEVPTPALFDRRGEYDVVNQHVNLLLRRVYRSLFEDREPRDVVVDFEPDFASARRGNALDAQAVLARYYNNVAVEHLAAGNRRLAYAHFKAAVRSDPTYAATYTNLAVLYRAAGHLAEAEDLLRQAVATADPPDVPLHALHDLLVEQGRTAEAKPLEARLQQRQKLDPYYWMALGLKYLGEDEPKRAVRAFEEAREIAASFPEVHRYLAIAYARAGDRDSAEKEIRALANLGVGGSKLAVLRRKLQAQ